MVPRPSPHPRLGEKKVPRGKQNQKEHLLDDLHVFIKNIIEIIQNGSKMVPK